jgi:uncharacterized NAD(P)/FAD-binding protein YdhS
VKPRVARTDEPPPDAKSLRPPRRIAIVGGGLTGTLVAAHLLRLARPVAVTMLERGPRFARGLAYGTDRPEHLLNVAAKQMSAFDEDPQHFQRFASRADPSPEAFHPRSRYADYLSVVLTESERASAPRGLLDKQRAEVVDVEPPAARGDSPRVVTSTGRRIAADHVVLASGNFPPPNPLPAIGLSPAVYASDPWRAEALMGIPRTATVLVVGTGLTAVDVVLALRADGHKGLIVLVSRRGLLPQPHRVAGSGAHPAPVEPSAFGIGGTALSILRAARREAKQRRAKGLDWREVMTGLRGRAQALWATLPPRERARFLRHVRPYWESHRHRMPPSCARTVEALRREGALEVRAARIVGVEPTDDGARVTLVARGVLPEVEESIDVSRIVNAVGPSTDWTLVDDPLVHALVERGLVVPDALRLGIETDAGGAVIGKGGSPSPWLWTAGPPRKPALWECTAVPEIRVQAADLARRLLAAV